jgi:hypothetical protein
LGNGCAVNVETTIMPTEQDVAGQDATHDHLSLTKALTIIPKKKQKREPGLGVAETVVGLIGIGDTATGTGETDTGR